VRGSLGAWRDLSGFPSSIFQNPVARSEFYLGLGFDKELTDFPAPVGADATALAGIVPEPSDGDDEVQADLQRNVVAYKRLLTFERRVRAFIDRAMTAEFGADWMARQLQLDMRDAWLEKRNAAIKKGEAELPLIARADFSDYIQIIEQRDNWKQVFRRVFHRPEDVKESFYRLSPVRICTMHARIVG
jgi:hypothetical protein